MLTRRRRPPLGDVSRVVDDGRGSGDLHDGQDLEEVVFRKVLLRVVFMEL